MSNLLKAYPSQIIRITMPQNNIKLDDDAATKTNEKISKQKINCCVWYYGSAIKTTEYVSQGPCSSKLEDPS